MKWLFRELLNECLQSSSFSIVEEFIPILDDYGREELPKYIFWEALISRKWWLAEICLSKGVCMAPIDICDSGPLHNAMWFCGDSPDVIAWLLNHGAELERRGSSNITPLIHATALGFNDTIELLLQRGADPNASTIIDDDETALMLAIKTNNERAAQTLLAFGSDIAQKNRWGQDAFALAQIAGHYGLCQLLGKSGGERGRKGVGKGDTHNRR